MPVPRPTVGSAHLIFSDGELRALALASDIALGKESAEALADRPDIRTALVRATGKVRTAIESGVVMPPRPR